MPVRDMKHMRDAGDRKYSFSINPLALDMGDVGDKYRGLARSHAKKKPPRATIKVIAR
jgi:hypothetical protein